VNSEKKRRRSAAVYERVVQLSWQDGKVKSAWAGDEARRGRGHFAKLKAHPKQSKPAAGCSGSRRPGEGQAGCETQCRVCSATMVIAGVIIVGDASGESVPLPWFCFCEGESFSARSALV